jgi:hypothetical protein
LSWALPAILPSHAFSFNGNVPGGSGSIEKLSLLAGFLVFAIWPNFHLVTFWFAKRFFLSSFGSR